jgi:hypothetical protein
MPIIVQAEDTQHAINTFGRFLRLEIAQLRDHGQIFNGGEMVVEMGSSGT